ncbi:MAG: EVE domain-containing protein [Deltaproteobacteria bacterium]|nr:EVE domain-containing protein [Deltaproteobacteria bacterium]MCB2186341.1 EVE domain-containing protein [Deltaproteobacteria bacterium]
MAAGWLVKSDPGEYAWADLIKDGRTRWDGVRNHQAKNNLAAMRQGDPVLFYHSGGETQVVGLARVVREAYPDPTAAEGAWLAVDLEPVTALARPVSLAQAKADPMLGGLALVHQPRLSVQPVGERELQRILELGGVGISPWKH